MDISSSYIQMFLNVPPMFVHTGGRGKGIRPNQQQAHQQQQQQPHHQQQHHHHHHHHQLHQHQHQHQHQGQQLQGSVISNHQSANQTNSLSHPHSTHQQQSQQQSQPPAKQHQFHHQHYTQLPLAVYPYHIGQVQTVSATATGQQATNNVSGTTHIAAALSAQSSNAVGINGNNGIGGGSNINGSSAHNNNRSNNGANSMQHYTTGPALLSAPMPPSGSHAFMTPGYMQLQQQSTAVMAATNAAAAAQYGNAVVAAAGNHNNAGNPQTATALYVPQQQSQTSSQQQQTTLHHAQSTLHYFHGNPAAAGPTVPQSHFSHIAQQNQLRGIYSAHQRQHTGTFLLSPNYFALPLAPAPRASLLANVHQQTATAPGVHVASHLNGGANRTAPTGPTAYVPSPFCTPPLQMNAAAAVQAPPNSLLASASTMTAPTLGGPYSYLAGSMAASNSSTSLNIAAGLGGSNVSATTSCSEHSGLKQRKHAIPIINPDTMEKETYPEPFKKDTAVEVKVFAASIADTDKPNHEMVKGEQQLDDNINKSVTVSLSGLHTTVKGRIDQQMQTDVVDPTTRNTTSSIKDSSTTTATTTTCAICSSSNDMTTTAVSHLSAAAINVPKPLIHIDGDENRNLTEVEPNMDVVPVRFEEDDSDVNSKVNNQDANTTIPSCSSNKLEPLPEKPNYANQADDNTKEIKGACITTSTSAISEISDDSKVVMEAKASLQPANEVVPKIQIDAITGNNSKNDFPDVKISDVTSSTNYTVKENLAKQTASQTVTANIGASRTPHSYQADANIKVLSKPTTSPQKHIRKDLDMPATQVQIISNSTDKDTKSKQAEYKTTETSTLTERMSAPTTNTAATISPAEKMTLIAAEKMMSNKQNNTSYAIRDVNVPIEVRAASSISISNQDGDKSTLGKRSELMPTLTTQKSSASTPSITLATTTSTSSQTTATMRSATAERTILATTTLPKTPPKVLSKSPTTSNSAAKAKVASTSTSTSTLTAISIVKPTALSTSKPTALSTMKPTALSTSMSKSTSTSTSASTSICVPTSTSTATSASTSTCVPTSTSKATSTSTCVPTSTSTATSASTCVPTSTSTATSAKPCVPTSATTSASKFRSTSTSMATSMAISSLLPPVRIMSTTTASEIIPPLTTSLSTTIPRSTATATPTPKSTILLASKPQNSAATGSSLKMPTNSMRNPKQDIQLPKQNASTMEVKTNLNPFAASPSLSRNLSNESQQNLSNNINGNSYNNNNNNGNGNNNNFITIGRKNRKMPKRAKDQKQQYKQGDYSASGTGMSATATATGVAPKHYNYGHQHQQQLQQQHRKGTPSGYNHSNNNNNNNNNFGKNRPYNRYNSNNANVNAHNFSNTYSILSSTALTNLNNSNTNLNSNNINRVDNSCRRGSYAASVDGSCASNRDTSSMGSSNDLKELGASAKLQEKERQQQPPSAGFLGQGANRGGNKSYVTNDNSVNIRTEVNKKDEGAAEKCGPASGSDTNTNHSSISGSVAITRADVIDGGNAPQETSTITSTTTTTVTSTSSSRMHKTNEDIINEYLQPPTDDNASCNSFASDDQRLLFINSSSSTCEEDDRKLQSSGNQPPENQNLKQNEKDNQKQMEEQGVSELRFGDFKENEQLSSQSRSDNRPDHKDFLPSKGKTVSVQTEKVASPPFKGTSSVKAVKTTATRNKASTAHVIVASTKSGSPPPTTSIEKDNEVSKSYKYSLDELKSLSRSTEACKPPLVACKKGDCIFHLFVSRHHHHHHHHHHHVPHHLAHGVNSSGGHMQQHYQHMNFNESLDFVTNKRRGQNHRKHHEHQLNMGNAGTSGVGGSGSAQNTGSSSLFPRKMEIIRVHLSLNEEIKLSECENAWQPQALRNKTSNSSSSPTAAGLNDDIEAVLKRVRGVLNKLTPDNFDVLLKSMTNISMNTQEKMHQVMLLIFEKTVGEPNFAPTYAKFCKMLFQDFKADNKILFNNALIKRIQQEFETNVNNADAKKVKLQPLVDKLESSTDPKERQEIKAEIEDQEYQFRRRAWGTVRFIGEMYKLQSLTSDRVLICIESLLEHGSEEKLEYMCKLLTTVGHLLEGVAPDHYTANIRMDRIFRRINDIVHKSKSSSKSTAASSASNASATSQASLDNQKAKISSRVRFMMQDVMDLRARCWDQPIAHNANRTNQTSDTGTGHQQQLQQQQQQSQRQQQQQQHAYNRRRQQEEGKNPAVNASAAFDRAGMARNLAGYGGVSNASTQSRPLILTSETRENSTVGESSGGGPASASYFLQKQQKPQLLPQQEQQSIDLRKLNFSRGDEGNQSMRTLGNCSVYIWRQVAESAAKGDNHATSKSVTTLRQQQQQQQLQQQNRSLNAGHNAKSNSLNTPQGGGKANQIQILTKAMPHFVSQKDFENMKMAPSAGGSTTSSSKDTLTEDEEPNSSHHTSKKAKSRQKSRQQYSTKDNHKILNRMVEDVLDCGTQNTWHEEVLITWMSISASHQISLVAYLLSDYLHLYNINKRHRSACAKIFSHLMRLEAFDKKKYSKAYAKFAEEVCDRLIDVPKGWNYLFEFLGPLMHERLLSISDIWQQRWNGDSIFTERFLLAFLTFFTREFGANYIRNLWNNVYKLDQGQYFGSDSEQWKEFVKAHGLQFLYDQNLKPRKDHLVGISGNMFGTTTAVVEQHTKRVEWLLTSSNDCNLAIDYINTNVNISNNFIKHLTCYLCCDYAITSSYDTPSSSASNSSASSSPSKKSISNKGEGGGGGGRGGVTGIAGISSKKSSAGSSSTDNSSRPQLNIERFRNKCTALLRLCLDADETYEICCLNSMVASLQDCYGIADSDDLICDIIGIMYDCEIISKEALEKWHHTNSGHQSDSANLQQQSSKSKTSTEIHLGENLSIYMEKLLCLPPSSSSKNEASTKVFI